MKATSCALCGAPRDMSLKSARCRRCHDEYFSRLRANRRQAPAALSEQTCRMCWRCLPISRFHRSCAYSTGYNAVCADCISFWRAMLRSTRRPQPASIVCNCCEVEKPRAAFYRSSEGGRRRVCKACFSARRRARLQALKTNDPAEYARQQQVNRDRTQRSRERRAAEMFKRVVRS